VDRQRAEMCVIHTPPLLRPYTDLDHCVQVF